MSKGTYRKVLLEKGCTTTLIGYVYEMHLDAFLMAEYPHNRMAMCDYAFMIDNSTNRCLNVVKNRYSEETGEVTLEMFESLFNIDLHV